MIKFLQFFHAHFVQLGDGSEGLAARDGVCAPARWPRERIGGDRGRRR